MYSIGKNTVCTSAPVAKLSSAALTMASVPSRINSINPSQVFGPLSNHPEPFTQPSGYSGHQHVYKQSMMSVGTRPFPAIRQMGEHTRTSFPDPLTSRDRRKQQAPRRVPQAKNEPGQSKSNKITPDEFSKNRMKYISLLTTKFNYLVKKSERERNTTPHSERLMLTTALLYHLPIENHSVVSEIAKGTYLDEGIMLAAVPAILAKYKKNKLNNSLLEKWMDLPVKKISDKKLTIMSAKGSSKIDDIAAHMQSPPTMSTFQKRPKEVEVITLSDSSDSDCLTQTSILKEKSFNFNKQLRYVKSNVNAYEILKFSKSVIGITQDDAYSSGKFIPNTIVSSIDKLNELGLIEESKGRFYLSDSGVSILKALKTSSKRSEI
ncbi:hypothetical protein GA565_13415 [Rouxiella sp. S1S-2]|uniref:hypothetical protein n=1 Tax=Rouxiella sp. S1S-2 TaxID=2653856 RepID=UPI00126577AD|nr:hypothetical protein [Rouxiella sp. S1S-2]KAB7896901.1 hypothetical protein GA565_13415 [Rouxiella sp. S1S-2]